MSGAALGMRFSVLGPIRAWRDGTELPLGSPQQRGMLAALVLREGRTVSASELIDGLWGEEPPQQALATVRTYAFRLRRVLGREALVSMAGGYAAHLEPRRVDAVLFEESAAEGHRHRAAGHAPEAARAFAAALALWQGEPLSGLPGPYAEVQRARLAERRIAVLEARCAADLDCGRHADLIAELAALAAEYPLREHVTELRMLALYRSGRQAEALEVFAAARRILDEEIGVAPGPGLCALQRRVLDADPELGYRPPPTAVAGASPGVGGSSPRPPRPVQLPADVADFTGRQAIVECLRRTLREGAAMPVAAVSGLGGVGKTALAVHVAHGLVADFPDGQLYTDLHGADGRASDPEEPLGAFLRALGLAAEAIPAARAERAALFRSVLHDRRVLIVLDNARDAEQVRPLLPGAPGCAVIVTSRARLAGLAGAQFTDLAVFSPDEALELFTEVVGAERVAAEPDAAARAVAACGHLPLAVRILASRLAFRPRWTIASLVARLADEQRRLDELRAGELTVEAAFRFGYDQLTMRQAKAVRALAVPDLPELTVPVVAAILAIPAPDAEDLAESLVDCSMLESTAPGRYRFHDLLRVFARRASGGGGKTDSVGVPAIEPILGRLVDHYRAATAAALGSQADRTGMQDERLHAAGESAHPGKDWARTEYAAVGAVVAQCAAAATKVADAAALLLGFRELCETGQATRSLGWAANTLLRAACGAGDGIAEARTRLVLGRLLLDVGSYTSAVAELLRARDLCGDGGAPRALLAQVHSALGTCFGRVGHHGKGIEALTTALGLWEETGDRTVVAQGLLALANGLVGAGRHGEAADAAARVLGMCGRGAAAGDAGAEAGPGCGEVPRLAAGAHGTLGMIAARTGEPDEAVGHYLAALALLRTDGSDRRVGWILVRLAEAQQAAGDSAGCAESAAEAVELLTADGDRRGREAALALLGRTPPEGEPRPEWPSWAPAAQR